MSQVKIQGNASGTGIFTVASPNSNTDRTLTLPDQTGTVLTNAGPFTANASASAGAVTIDASNNVGVGTGSPGVKLDVLGSDNVIVAKIKSATAALRFLPEDGGASKIAATNAAESAFYPIVMQGSDLRYVTGTTERARIDSSGNLYLGGTTTLASGPYKLNVETNLSTAYGVGVQNTGTSTGGYFVGFFNSSNTQQGGIVCTNSSTVSYNTSSDYRLKENIAPMTGALAKVQALKPVTYKWKADGSDGEGFIAHELAEVVPQCVTGKKDAVDDEGNIKPQGIDTSFLVATLTAAIQELKGIVDSQAAEIAALKGAQA